MVLKMVLAGKEIDRVSIEAHRLNQMGYLEAMLECLRAKHQELLPLSKEQAVFYLQVRSRMNVEDSSNSD